MQNEEVKKLNRIARVLEELPVDDRRAVLAFLSAPPGPRPEVAVRVSRMLAELDATAQRRVVKFFEDQLGPAGGTNAAS